MGASGAIEILAKTLDELARFGSIKQVAHLLLNTRLYK
jgi:hypothetical protein